MKIGELTKAYGVSNQTIRYYVKMGLLIPETKEKQYVFNEQSREDLELILKLKQFDLSLADIHRILSLNRISHFVSREDRDTYRTILHDKLAEIEREENRLQAVAADIREELRRQLESERTSMTETKAARGISLRFLPYLYCPHCNTPLNISDMQISQLEVHSARLHCDCGYSARIDNGILYSDQGLASPDEVVDVERRFYKDSPPIVINLHQKSYNWITKHIQHLDLTDKIVMEPLINTCCYLFTNIHRLNPKALYIITDKHAAPIEHYKSLFESMGLDVDLLFIVDASHKYPLKQGCVDLCIDDTSTVEYAAYESEGSLFDRLQPYLHPRTHWIGVFHYFDINSRSYRQFREKYPLAQKVCYDLAEFNRTMRSHPLQLLDDEIIGTVDQSGEGIITFSFHVPGDPLSWYAFHYKLNLSE